MSLVVFDGGRPGPAQPLARDGDDWVGAVAEGTVYGLVADGPGSRCDPSKVLLDPRATAVWFPPGHDRRLAAHHGAANAGCGPLAVARRWPAARPSRHSTRPPVVYEVHVDGCTRLAGGAAPGTFGALIEQLPRLATLGISVLELLPVHQPDPQEGSYWGYMPLAFGAVDPRFAACADAAGELAALVTAAHDHDIEVWLDVVFNHTTEAGASGPVYAYRGLADASYYRLRDDVSYVETTGCGNAIDATSPAAQELIVWALDRLADLGVDGFRFDLAAVLSHSEAFIARLDRWADGRGVRMVAEPWDAAGRYQLGGAWPGRGWMQWNDRFRDDVRSFLRGDVGCVPALPQRLQGSPDLFAAPMHSVNFLSCQTASRCTTCSPTMSPTTTPTGTAGPTAPPTIDRGTAGGRGRTARRPRSPPCATVSCATRGPCWRWPTACRCAPEVTSSGAPRAATTTPTTRTTRRRGSTGFGASSSPTWRRFVAELLALRRRHPVLSQPEFWGDDVTWFGVDGQVGGGDDDDDPGARALAWTVGGLYVMANAWWEHLEFTIGTPGAWTRVVDTTRPPPGDIVAPVAGDLAGDRVGATHVVGPRSVVVLER